MTIQLHAMTKSETPSTTDHGAATDDASARMDARTELPDPARRALAEATARRSEVDAWAASREAEMGGRGGKDPVRYGDWEVKGLACDF